MTAEEWRPVVGNADYAVSNLGRVVSHKGREPRVLAPYLNAGYPAVTLRGDAVKRIRKVHALVAEAFIGPRPDGLEVRHIDGDRMHCSLSNIRYGTRAENMQDRLAHGRHPMANKTHCPWRHEYTPENTYMQSGSRVCRTCKNARQREYAARRALRAANVLLIALRGANVPLIEESAA